MEQENFSFDYFTLTSCLKYLLLSLKLKFVNRTFTVSSRFPDTLPRLLVLARLDRMRVIVHSMAFDDLPGRVGPCFDHAECEFFRVPKKRLLF